MKGMQTFLKVVVALATLSAVVYGTMWLIDRVAD